jgi:hypothetical protein
MLCYFAPSRRQFQVHGDSFRDGSGRSLDSPEGQCSIGFQPVFFCTIERAFQVSTVLPSDAP